MVAYADLAVIHGQLAAALGASSDEPLAPTRPAEDYLPTPARLQQGIAAGDVDATLLLLDMLITVAPRWIEVQSEDIRQLERIGVHAQAMASSAVAIPSGLTYRYNNYAFRMSLDVRAATASSQVSMRSLCEASGSTLDNLLGRLTATPARAVGAVMALRRFDDVLIRILAQRQAAQATGLPVARIATLHRIEGNLCVYPSHDSLELGVPSAAGSGLGGRGIGHEPMLINRLFRPSFGHLVWLADEAKVRAKIGTEDLLDFALAWAFMLHAIGGDRVAMGLGHRRLSQHFATWSTDNRMAVNAAKPWSDRFIEALGRWSALKTGLELKRVHPHDGAADEALRVAPRDPVGFLAGILAEGAAYQDALSNGSWLAGAPTGLRLPAGMAAARYNWQATPEGMAATIYSALAAARLGGSGALKSAIGGDAALSQLLAAAATDVKAQQVAERQRIAALPASTRDREMNAAMRKLQAAAISAAPPFTPMDPDFADAVDQLRPLSAVRDWLLRDDNLERLGRYFDRTGTGVWGGYAGVRRYGVTERRLHEFYARVLA